MAYLTDEILIQCVPDIDLILGGHDHDPYFNFTNSTLIVKSGMDFKEFSNIIV